MNMTCICILNYNNGEKTIRCISSVLDQTLKSYRLIIVDNNSTDDSVKVILEFIKTKRLPFRYLEHSVKAGIIAPDPSEILIVKSDRNGGYSYGNNIAIRIAKSMNIFSNLLIINNDVVLKENFLEEMIRKWDDACERHHSQKLALGATELGTDGTLHHAGFQYINLLSGITFSSPLFPSFRYIPGSCIFTDINAPLLDESFFLYFDDVQYSKILERNGYILENSQHSVYVHEVGGTAKQGLQWQIFKSLWRFYVINYPILLPVVIPFRMFLVLYLLLKRL